MSSNGISPASPGSAERAAEAARQAVEKLGQSGKKCACQLLSPKRKAHALIGLYLTLFLLAHLAIAAVGAQPSRYDALVSALHARPLLIVAACWLLIVAPLLAQFYLGFFLLAHHGLKFDVKKCERGGKPRFYLQRITGIAIFVFMALHLLTLAASGFLRYPNHPEAYGATLAAFGSSAACPLALALLWKAAALAGLLGAAWHMGNGLWSGAILFKLAPSAGSVWLNRVAIGVGAFIAVLSTAVWALYAIAPVR